jgi:hypothetical protein
METIGFRNLIARVISYQKSGTSGSAVGQFDCSAGVALDSNDDDYITYVSSHRLQEFSGNGDFISTFGNEGDGDGQFMEPEGVDVDYEGNTFAADTGNLRIQVFSQK